MFAEIKARENITEQCAVTVVLASSNAAFERVRNIVASVSGKLVVVVRLIPHPFLHQLGKATVSLTKPGETGVHSVDFEGALWPR